MAKVKSELQDSTRKISKSLQDTVGEHQHIEQVHFDADGNHHFNVHEHATGLYARIHVKTVKNNNSNIESQIVTPILNTKIVESIGREQILSMSAESDIALSMNALTAEEQKAIFKMRQGI